MLTFKQLIGVAVAAAVAFGAAFVVASGSTSGHASNSAVARRQIVAVPTLGPSAQVAPLKGLGAAKPLPALRKASPRATPGSHATPPHVIPTPTIPPTVTVTPPRQTPRPAHPEPTQPSVNQD